MEKNFKLGQSNEIVYEGRVFDLHNCYDYLGIVINSNRTAKMIFQPHSEYGVGQPSLSIEFDGIGYLEISKNLGSRTVQYLNEIGYLGSDELDDDSLIAQEQATSTDHLFFRLGEGGDDFVRIHSVRARLIVK